MAGCAAPHTWPTSISRSALSPTTQTTNQPACRPPPLNQTHRPASRSLRPLQLKVAAAGQQGPALQKGR
jgi:hypothetical protein